MKSCPELAALQQKTNQTSSPAQFNGLENHTGGGGGKTEAKVPVDADGCVGSLEPKRSAQNEEEEEEPTCFLFSIPFGFQLFLFSWFNPTNKTANFEGRKTEQ